MSKEEDNITVTIKIGNTRDNDLIKVGKEYNFNVRRNTFICELLDYFIACFDSEAKMEIKKYVLFSKKMIRLYNKNIISDVFQDPEASDLEIYDRDETIFYAILI
jgi:hypothetical protein